MTLLSIKSLLSSNGTQIKFLASENNKTLHEKLNGIARNHTAQEVISIPETSSKFEMGAKLETLRDFSTPALFRTPDSFITISHEIARMLRSRGAICPIKAAYIGIDTDRFRPQSKKETRTALDLSREVPAFGVVGRFEFRQKQQHLLGQQRWRGRSLIQPRLDGPADRSA